MNPLTPRRIGMYRTYEEKLEHDIIFGSALTQMTLINGHVIQKSSLPYLRKQPSKKMRAEREGRHRGSFVRLAAKHRRQSV